ncbi:peptidase domain-containing ABC transporter [Foetidibacter luteolus]|uniref:peptidase domain-containing ABC transporter n=1 Tax=Foetidibacter luteolus TaxID=2608880 RepID=UPI00129A4B1A|nr:peptidase domain-containing ABC transporter [Foetidibacter luteolus]
MKQFPYYRQTGTTDCGPACLRMVAKYYGLFLKADSPRLSGDDSSGREGMTLLGLRQQAEKLGFETSPVELSMDELIRDAAHPSILHWNQHHFVVLYPFSSRLARRYRVADPLNGMLSLTEKEFKSHWITDTSVQKEKGTALLLAPLPEFYRQQADPQHPLNWSRMFKYLKKSRWQIVQISFALIITTALQLLFPYLTKSIVDIGITGRDMSYMKLVLMAQLMLVVSRSIIDIVRNRLLLLISGRLNLYILSDFWHKLTRLPIAYFTLHPAGDIMQRLGDHRQVQEFLTGTAINTGFAFVSFLVFAAVLAFYNPVFFLIFTTGSVMYYLWVSLFLRLRRRLNYQAFSLSAMENNATIQLVNGMQEIKLHNAEQAKRWEWENIQARIFKLTFKKLSYTQLQQAGAILISQGKDIIISFMAAKLVFENRITLGSMLAIQYIIGQLAAPIEQFILFLQQGQDAGISMERLNEVHEAENEETDGNYSDDNTISGDVKIKNLSFSYPGAGNPQVIRNLSLCIPEGKVTAIVGASGSGKTTLIKLLLKFFDNHEGEIMVGPLNLKNIRPAAWRSCCSAVMQNGYIFNDTVAGNIAVGEEDPREQGLLQACLTANILQFVESLPNGFHTSLGVNGSVMSEGQKQRLLIARALYKEPAYLFFDEATNSLDTENERVIVGNLRHFFSGRTVLVVAHRLSTVKNADKIVVLENGCIVEEGTHNELSILKGRYYELVRNQLELDN